MPKVARKAFGEVWNPVCCHGERTVKLVSIQERTLRNPSEGGHLGTTSDDEIRGRPRSPSYCKPVINILDIETRTQSVRNRLSFKKRFNNEIDVSFFFILVSKTC